MAELRWRRAFLLPVALGIVLARPTINAQLSYSSGQNASPAYEGWETDAAGNRYFLFGYMNRNWEEEIDVPVGPDNSIEPGGPDQGQPTRFYPRRNRFVFRVPVPKDFGDKEMIWTLTIRGKTEKAWASLKTDYFIDDVVKASETGALGAGASSPEIRANRPPVVTIDGAKQRTARTGEPVMLRAIVTDDGVPKPRSQGGVGSGVRASTQLRPGESAASQVVTTPGGASVDRMYVPPRRNTVGKTVGLHLSWIVYRGPGVGIGNVRFDPAQVKVWEDTRTGANSPWAPLWVAPPVPADGKYLAEVTFDRPGTYLLKAVADDGALLGMDDLTVTVTGSTAP
jgi:hypothetical protein